MFFLKNYKSIIFVVLLFLFALIMLSYNAKHDEGGGFFRKIIMEAAAPFQKFAHVTVKSMGKSWDRYVFLIGLVEENENLTKTISELEAELLFYKEGYSETERLRKLLALKESAGYSFIAARVIAREQGALSKTIIIDKGSFDGLKSGMPVIAPPGLAGRVVHVSWNVSKVLLITDENSNVDVLLDRTRVQGIFSGEGLRGGKLKYITKNQDVIAGDIVISSGMGGVFPKGLLVGQVRDVTKPDTELFLNISVTPYVDFSKLEEVLVLISEEKGKK
ncbi:MAG: rod shape-determining protein MreC [Syntrophaceae bacterium]|nr:rod shape-determining protein MreC [Syntrophaceae bacterium]